jgi:FKBP-type peptidyl-prolyl cis-trans isomerase
MAQPELKGPKRATAGWTPWVLGLGALVAIGAGVAAAGTAPLVRHETASGLQYQLVREGDPKRSPPGPHDGVVVNYVGRLPDGQIFDSSFVGGRPAQFRVDQVVPGFGEALQLLRPGGQARVTIPSRLAYGPQGAGGVIPPNTDLTFDIELIEVVPAQAEPAR